jgi:hypothetical protein
MSNGEILTTKSTPVLRSSFAMEGGKGHEVRKWTDFRPVPSSNPLRPLNARIWAFLAFFNFFLYSVDSSIFHHEGHEAGAKFTARNLKLKLGSNPNIAALSHTGRKLCGS